MMRYTIKKRNYLCFRFGTTNIIFLYFRTSILLGDKPFIHSEDGVGWTLLRPYFDL
jgi:hypothetical protein